MAQDISPTDSLTKLKKKVSQEVIVEEPPSEDVAKYCFELLGSMVVGDSALHLAVVNSDLPAVKFLISQGADVNKPVKASLFGNQGEALKASIKTKKTVRNGLDNLPSHKYGDYGYYGEYPLSFAGVFSFTEIYDYLLRKGADPNNQDSFGNTVLHLIIIYNQIEMFSYSMRHPKHRANPWIKNKEGLTPIAICAKLGLAEMFNEIMELSRVEIWKYSYLECSLYPLTSLDTIGPGGTTEKESALWLMVNGETLGHLEMLHHDVVQKVIFNKWEVFGKKRFIHRVTLWTLHCICMSIAIYLRPKLRTLGYDMETNMDAGRYLMEITIVGGSFSTFMFHINEPRQVGFKIFLKSLKNSPTKVCMLLNTGILLLLPGLRTGQLLANAMHHSPVFHFLDCESTTTSTLINNTFYNTTVEHCITPPQLLPYVRAEETLLALAMPCGWAFMMFFLKIHENFGPMIITLYEMIAKDLTKVMIIFMIFWLIAASVFYLLYKDTGVESMEHFDDSIMNVFLLNFGSFETYKSYTDTKYPELTSLISSATMILMPILLLNMLIATMGNTLMRITSRAKLEWFSQWAKTVIVLERAFKPDQLDSHQQTYTEVIDNTTRDSRYSAGNMGYLKDKGDEYGEVRSVRVVKRSPTTRAFSIKRSKRNWRWIVSALRRLCDIKRQELHVQRRITFEELFGDEEQLDSDYLKDKKLAENLSKLNVTRLFRSNFERFDLSQVAGNAMSAMVEPPSTAQIQPPQNQVEAGSSQPGPADAAAQRRNSTDDLLKQLKTRGHQIPDL